MTGLESTLRHSSGIHHTIQCTTELGTLARLYLARYRTTLDTRERNNTILNGTVRLAGFLLPGTLGYGTTKMAGMKNPPYTKQYFGKQHDAMLEWGGRR